MAYTATTLIQRTRRFMGDWPDIDTLTVSLSSSGTTAVVADTSLYAKNWTLQFETEGVIVRTAPSSGTSLTVSRAAFGTTSASHASSTPILVRPAFIDQEYLDALNAGILSAFPFLYRPVIDESLTADSTTYEYTVPNMPGTYDGASIPIPRIYKVEVLDSGDTVWREKRDWEIHRGATPKLKFRRSEDGTIRILGYGPFPPLSGFTDSLDTLFPVAGVHALTEYAASCLTESGEARRVRVDTGSLDQREQANRVGSSAAISRDLYQRFFLKIQNLMPPMPVHVKAVL